MSTRTPLLERPVCVPMSVTYRQTILGPPLTAAVVLELEPVGYLRIFRRENGTFLHVFALDAAVTTHRPTSPMCSGCGEFWPCAHERDRARLQANLEQPGCPRHDLGCLAGSMDGFGHRGGPCSCPAAAEVELAYVLEAVGWFLRGGEGFFKAHRRWLAQAAAGWCAWLEQ